MAGFGSIGRRHARLLRQRLPDARIGVLTRRPPADGDPAVDAWFTDPDEAVRYRPDVAVVAGPATAHAAVAIPLARAGVHLLVEKPLAARAAEARALSAAARDAGVVAMAGYNLRFSAALGRFRERLQAGEAGTVRVVHCEVGQYLPEWRPQTDYRDTVSAQRALGGGVLLELSHEIDYLGWLFGDVARVSAYLATAGGLDVDVEDTALLTLEVRRDDPLPPLPIALRMDFLRRDAARRCSAVGDLGTLTWDGIARMVALTADATEPAIEKFDHEDRDATFLAQLDHWFACIESARRPDFGRLDDAVRTVEIVEAARRSAQRGAAFEEVGGRP